ncbi:MSP (Major sperm protein) domain containing protein [Novymonas esmeraldas]|uniref:MSP (Major sperm protein) domain containing protein n=1 Tax=Novymonas esmeraldas TaxID=1808958 RepID=A0AAW0EWG5_9TRYP
MAADTLQVKLSQDSLFFPLPFTNATIDNVVQVKNTLPAVQGDPRANVVSFKILSEVQYRYSVRPPVGFIGAGEHVTIVFSFNPEHVKAGANAAERQLPTEATKDAIHIDFAVVDAAAAGAALAHWTPASKESRSSREVMADAAQFWKARGQVRRNSPTTMRFKLRCIFATRQNVPESLVMCMKEEESKSAAVVDAAAAALPPKTRPPATSSTQPQNTAPPEAPPHRHSESPRNTPTASTPRSDANRPTRPAAAARPSGVAVTATTAAAPPPPKSSSSSPSSGASTAALTPKGIVTQVMHYKLSYKVVGVLLVLTLLCGLLDHSNFLTWLLATR